jgi:hypothetical protein
MSNVAPEIIEADLRNTAMVLEHLGHARNEYLEGDTGTVCADGALRLATINQVQRLNPWANGVAKGPLVMNPVYGSSDRQQLNDRYRAAVEALLPLLPDRCTDSRHIIADSGFSYPLWVCVANRNTGVLDGVSRIHHFNDWVCTGGDDVVDLFVQAAEKVRANA